MTSVAPEVEARANNNIAVNLSKAAFNVEELEVAATDAASCNPRTSADLGQIQTKRDVGSSTSRGPELIIILHSMLV